jgi:hypothetical protein
MIRSIPWLPALIVGAVLATLIASAFAARVAHPYDLEWMEGAILSHAWRIQRSLPLYPEPGPDWIPFLYPPGYPALLSLAGDGLSHAWGRALSWLGTAIALVSVATIVGRHGVGPHRATAGLLAALVLLGTWVDGGTFFDLVRADALALGLTVAALALALERRAWGPVAGGLLLCAAFLFKHPMAAFGLPIALGLWARDGRARGAAAFTAAAAVPALAAVAWLQLATGGTFLTWILAVPMSHDAVSERIWPGLPWELGTALPLASLVVGGAAIVAAAPEHRRSLAIGVALGIVAFAGVALGARDGATALGPLDQIALRIPAIPLGSASRLHVAGPIATGAGAAALTALAIAAVMAIGRLVREPGSRLAWLRAAALPALVGGTALALAASMRGHHGGYLNVYLPLYAIMAVGFGLATAAGAARWPRVGPWALGLIAAGQLGWSLARTDRAALVPTPLDLTTGDAIVARLKVLDGPVWAPVAPWMTVQAGHPPGPHLVALWDVAMHPSGPWPDTGAKIEAALRDGHWDYVLDGKKSMGFGIESAIVKGRRLALPSQALWPKAGWRTRPAVLYEFKLRDTAIERFRPAQDP